METIRLVEGIRRRSESAFREVYDNYFKLLKHVVYKMVKNHQIADELVQETCGAKANHVIPIARTAISPENGTH